MMLQYKKLVATNYSHHFREAVAIVADVLRPPAPNEVVVRNFYCGINSTDTNVTSGHVVYMQPFPVDLGTEAAGEVIEVGRDVQSLKVGDHVVTGMPGSGFREYSVLDHKLLIPVPEATPDMLSLVISGSAASIALEVIARLTGDKTVLVTAAAAMGSGLYAVQLALMVGDHVIATCQTDEQAALLQSLGCQRVVHVGHEHLDVVLKSEYPDGVDVVYESVGGELFDIAVDNLAPRGRLIIHGYISEYTRDTQIIAMRRIYSDLLWKSASLHGFRLSDYAQFVPSHVRHMMALLGDGKLRAVIDPTPFTGIAAIPDAVEYLIAGNAHGKVIVKL